MATLPANNAAYTAIVRGVNNGTGIGVVEAYDLDQTVDSKLANISTRGFVSTGDNVMIGGTIILGSTPTRVLLRAIGPSLTNFGVLNALQDPTLELHDGNGALLASNDNWRDTQEAEIIATGIPPTNDLESAILQTLQPGAYTAIVRGKDNSTGVTLVEAYQTGSTSTPTPNPSPTPQSNINSRRDADTDRERSANPDSHAGRNAKCHSYRYSGREIWVAGIARNGGDRRRHHG